MEIEKVKKHYLLDSGFFSSSRRVLRAVDDVSLSVKEGQTVSIAGESGCGKTTLGMLCLGLLEPTEGIVRFNGQDLSRVDAKQMRALRSEMQMIFQDPYGALNPRKTLRQILRVPLDIHLTMRRNEKEDRINEMLESVGLSPAHMYADRYPDDLSGGQRQRVVIARAVMTNPKFVVADEPVSALDISVRAQILNLMRRLQEEMKLAYLYISHDLSVTRAISHIVAIMYLGKIVELAPVDDIFEAPLHPYTQALLSAVPLPNPRRTRAKSRIVLTGERPSPIDIPLGCRFRSRCSWATSECAKSEPELTELKDGHFVRCKSA